MQQATAVQRTSISGQFVLRMEFRAGSAWGVTTTVLCSDCVLPLRCDKRAVQSQPAFTKETHIMGRSVVAVIVAYISMFILNLLVFVGLYAFVGPAQAFKPSSYLASNRWIVMSFVAISITAIIAGLICAAIARGGRAPLAMAIVVLVIGLVLAIPSVMKHRANEHMIRTGDVPSMEA